MNRSDERTAHGGADALLTRRQAAASIVSSNQIPAELIPALLALRPHDAAKALGISPRKLWALTASGEIPCVRIGRAVRYAPADLEAFIERSKAKGDKRRR